MVKSQKKACPLDGGIKIEIVFGLSLHILNMSASIGEADVVRCKPSGACYIKGKLMPTRGFGDCYLKYVRTSSAVHLQRPRLVLVIVRDLGE